jgi:threonine aldolase
MVGGGMRQAGVIAAAGIVALETMVDRLAEDHANAKYLAENMADLPAIVLDPAKIKTNIVLFELEPNGIDARELAARVKREGVLLEVRGKYSMRAATHYGVERADCERALTAISNALSSI